MKRKSICLLLIAVLFSALVPCAFAETESRNTLSADEKRALHYLGKALEEPAGVLMKYGEDVSDIYSELDWASVADTFSAKFDLRDRGTVTPVKN